MTLFSEKLKVLKEDYNKIIYPEELLNETCKGCVRCEKEIMVGMDIIAACKITILIFTRKTKHAFIGGTRKSMKELRKPTKRLKRIEEKSCGAFTPKKNRLSCQS